MQTGFYIKFQCHDEWVTMPKIRLTEEKNFNRHTTYFLPGDGTTIVAEQIANNYFTKFCLSSVNENNTRVISIQPQFVLCNFSKYNLMFHAFCIHRNEKLSYEDVVKSLSVKSKPTAILDNQQTVDNT